MNLELSDEIQTVDAREQSGETSTARVIFVITQSGSRANGGVESITEVVERLRRVRPLIVTQLETPINRRWQKAGTEVQVWPMRAALRPYALLRANLRMYKLIRSTGSRVVHCNDILALWHTSFGARAAGAAVLFNVRNIKPAERRYGWRWRAALRISNRQLVLSKEMRGTLANRLGLRAAGGAENSGRIDYIYSAVDPARFSPASGDVRAALRSSRRIGEREFAIGIVAAFEPRKAQLDFINEAAPLLFKTLPNARIYFIGDFAPERNDYARQCLSAVKSAGLEATISFVGYTSEMAEWYRALDLVVVASRHEGLARCMIESLACATPVVSFDVCSAREILTEGECGIVSPDHDYRELVEQLVRLATERKERERLGRNGAEVARKLFDPRVIVDRYEQLYTSMSAD